MDKLDPQADFTLTLVKVARLYRQGVDKALSGLGLSDALALPVVLLGRRPEGVRQNQLADELGVEGPSLVRLLDRLVEHGLVERREDPLDRRAKLVHLTEAGRAHSRRASHALDQYRSNLLEDVQEADVETARSLLHLLEQRLNRRRETGDL
jgi:MarR family transcriptional regulator for hemolysin